MFKRIFIYLATLPLSVLAVAVIWGSLAPKRLYYCWDEVPPLMISWYPPFIHPKAHSLEGRLQDYYVWPEWAVYGVWFLLVAFAFLLPAWIARKIGRTHE